MAGIISQIAVRLSADTAEFRRKLAKAQKSVGAMSRRLQRGAKMATKYAAAIGAAGAAMSVHLVNTSLKVIDRQVKLARQLGTTQAAVAGLTRAAKLSSIEQKQLEKNMQAYSKRLGEAIGGTGEAKDALEKMNLSAHELATMPLPEQLALIADRINSMGTQAEKSAAASDLFSRAGLDMLNFFEGGGEAIRTAASEVRSFGLAVSDVDARQVEAANDAMTSISDTLRGFFNRVAVKLAPAIEQVANQFKQAAIESEGFKEQAEDAAEAAIKGIGKTVIGAGKLVSFVESNADTVNFGIIGLLLFGKRGAAIGAVIGKIFAEVKKEAKLLGVGVDKNAAKLARLEKQRDNLQRQVDQGRAAAKRAADDVLISQQQITQETAIYATQLRGVRQEIAELKANMSPEERSDYEEFFNKPAEAAEGLGEKIQGVGRAILEAGAASARASILPEAPNIQLLSVDGDDEATRKRRERLLARFETERSLELEHQQALRDLRTAFENGEITTEAEFNERRLQLQRQFYQRLQGIRDSGYRGLERLTAMHFSAEAAEVAGATKSIISTLAGGSKKAFEIQKQWALADALISTYQGIAAGVRLGWPMGIPAVAWAAATGFAQVKNIRSQSFAGGGGGAGGAAAGGGGGAGGSSAGSANPQPPVQDLDRVVTVQGIEPGTLFSDKMVRGLIERLNEAASDGATIRVA